MRVLSNITDKATLALSRVIAPHAGLGAGSGAGAESLRRFSRGLAISCASIALIAPAALTLPLGAAVALPSGLALSASVLLFGLLGGIVHFSRNDAEETAKIVQPAINRDPYALCPGLVLELDAQGVVERLSGRDRTAFDAYLRDPAGRSFIEQIHVSDRIAVAAAIDALREGEGMRDVELRLERRAGHVAAEQYLYARAAFSAERAEDGTLSGIFCQMSNIGAERSLMDMAHQSECDAQNANEAKSRFLAAVSHELRTPLNAILGFSDILIGEYFGKLGNDRQREYVRLIRHSGQHLLSVVNTMLDMSKIEAGRYELIKEHFAIADAVTACESMLSLQAAEKGVTLTARIQRDIGEVIADQRAIQQVLINLVGNAIKFTDAGGVVSMDAVIDGENLKISVGDTGIGIAAEKLALIGQPFMQVQNEYTRRYEGTGLGLSLVKGLVALHGGTFAISSKTGEGTLVTVTVPLDGTGSADVEGDEEGNMVVFPPRLTSAQDKVERHWEAEAHDTAKAQSA